MSAEREAFEAWAGNSGMLLRRSNSGDGTYAWATTQLAWDTWQARAALSAPTPQPQAAPGWQPIETAPKDGSFVLLWERAPYSMTEILRWEKSVEGWVSRHWGESEGFCGSLVPTHWMPLPAAPTAQQAPEAAP